MRPSGYILDLDGTLLDTLESLAASFNRSLDQLGYPTHEVDAYRYFIGDGLQKCVERCLPGDAADEKVVRRMMAVQQADYESSWDTATPYPGIPEALMQLQQRGVQLAVLSNKNHAFTEKCVRHFFPDVAFDVVLGYSGEFPHKPDAAGARHVCRVMGIEPGRVAFVGDTATDMQTAVACGNLAVGALWGFRTAEELTHAGADRLIDAPADLLTIEGQVQ